VESTLQYHASNQEQKEYDTVLKRYIKANSYAVTLLSTTIEDELLQLI
jgi:hypothetical protein